MDTTLFELSPWRAALLALVPLLYVGAAVAACGMRPAIGWRLMRAGAALAVAAALLSLGWLLVEGAAAVPVAVGCVLAAGGAGGDLVADLPGR